MTLVWISISAVSARAALRLGMFLLAVLTSSGFLAILLISLFRICHQMPGLFSSTSFYPFSNRSPDWNLALFLLYYLRIVPASREHYPPPLFSCLVNFDFPSHFPFGDLSSDCRGFGITSWFSSVPQLSLSPDFRLNSPLRFCTGYWPAVTSSAKLSLSFDFLSYTLPLLLS